MALPIELYIICRSGWNFIFLLEIQLFILPVGKNERHSGSRWNRRHQELDVLMAGNFREVLMKVVCILGAVMLVLILIGGAYSLIRGKGLFDPDGWYPWNIFIQFTNPSIPSDGNLVDVILMIFTNLVGLFFINGLLLTLLVNWVVDRRERFTKGEARYDNIADTRFAVIIGGHKIVASLARDLIEKYEYVIVQTQRDVERLRREIFAAISDEEKARDIVIYSGDRTSWHELADLHLDRAAEVFIIGEGGHIDGSSHDSINMQCWKIINEHICESRQPRVPCHIMFEYQSTFSAFQFTDLRLEQSTAFRFIPFSVYENWAQQVLLGSGKERADGISYLPLDGAGGLPESSHERVHLIVVGMSKMGMALAIEAAHVAHYPNFNNVHAGSPRTLITFIDRNARREMMYFMGRHPELFRMARWRYVKAPSSLYPETDEEWNIYDTRTSMALRTDGDDRWHNPMSDSRLGSPYCGMYLGEELVDIDFEFIEGDVALPSIQKYIADACADNAARAKERRKAEGCSAPIDSSRTTIAVCLPVAAEAMSAALYFTPEVYEGVQQIWVQQPESGALVDAVRYGLTGRDNARFSTLRPFGMIDCCDYMLRSRDILPRLVAYAYDCMDRHTTLSAVYQGKGQDYVVAAACEFWEQISQDGGKSAVAKRWSNVYCANSFVSKVRATGISVDEKDCIRDANAISTLAKVEHNRWVVEQLLLGMRPIGPEFAAALPIEDDDLRATLKSRNIHPDIVSNDVLGKTKAYDEGIVRIIPLAMAIAGEYSDK